MFQWLFLPIYFLCSLYLFSYLEFSLHVLNCLLFHHKLCMFCSVFFSLSLIIFSLSLFFLYFISESSTVQSERAQFFFSVVSNILFPYSLYFLDCVYCLVYRSCFCIFSAFPFFLFLSY